MAPLVRTGGSRHTGLAALPHRNIHAGHVSEIYMCINVANAIKRVLEESGESFSNYLLQSDGDWVMKYVDRATDLWEEVKKIAPETNSEELEQLEIRIKQLTSDLEGTISLWKKPLG